MNHILSFIYKYGDKVVITLVFIAVIFNSVQNLTTKPEPWTDEAISIHIARSFTSAAVLSVQTAPGVFFESPHLIQATGYPVTIPLAAVFKLWGYSFEAARVYMLFWLLGTLLAVFFLARALFSKQEAILSLLLIASFASFYAHGRVVTGEIPGFLFLLAGLYFFLMPRQAFFAGILWGFAVVAKPSVFAALIPTIFLALLFERLPWKVFFKKLFVVAAGMIPAGLLWIALVLDKPFSGTVWRDIFLFYGNPYGEDTTANVLKNLSGFFDSTTLIYFGSLFVSVFISWIVALRQRSTHSFLYSFIVLYTLLAFAYYLRSSGYLRYILIAELLILFVLPHAIKSFLPHILERFKITNVSMQGLAASLVSFLVLIQGIHLFTAADISSGDTASRIGQYIETQYPEKTVGLVNVPIVGLFTDSAKTTLSVRLLGLNPIGESPLLQTDLPDVVTLRPSEPLSETEKQVLGTHFVPDTDINGHLVFKRYK